MLPRVVLHNAVSVDGRMDWLAPDLGLFYELVSVWEEDATLVGSETILSAEEELAQSSQEVPEAAKRDASDSRPLLVIPDSRGCVRSWHLLRRQPYWREAVALCTRSTPGGYISYLAEVEVEHIVAGDDRVDLRTALEELSRRYGVKVVRVDSGGTLNGALLRAGLVDEVSLVIGPSLVGGITPRSMFRGPDLESAEGVIGLKLIHCETLRDDTVWLRYSVVRHA